MDRMYQKSNIKDANNASAAPTYWSLSYLWTMFEVWYKIEPEASTTIPTLNHNPKSKPNNKPATIRPNAIKNPTAKADFINEKSFFVNNTIADNPENNDKVIIAAW